MSKTMQDKETKERKEMIKRLLKQLEYYYSDNEKHTRCPLCGLDFSKFDEELDRIEQEAERRGYRKGIELEQLRNAEFFEEDYQDKKRLEELEAELKLLEEENGKQNARS